MKKSRVRLIIIVVAILIIGITAFFVYKKSSNTSDKTERTQEDERILETGVVSQVYYGSLESSYSGTGTVASDEEEICDVFYFETANDDDRDKIKSLAGKEYNSGDEIYTVGDNKAVAPADGRVVRTNFSDGQAEIYFLNYSKLYVTTYVPYDSYLMMGYDSETVLRVDNQTIETNITYISYLYDEDGIEVRIACNQYIMPNRTVDVEIKLDETDEMLFIPAIELQDVGGYTFVYVVTDEANRLTEQVEVEIGRTLTVYEDGNAFDYYEILSGLSAGQKLVSIPWDNGDI